MAESILPLEKEQVLYVTVDASRVVPRGGEAGEIRHISCIDQKADRYFVVAFPRQTDETDKMFSRYGFSEKDVFYIRPKVRIVRQKYTDDYGNQVSELPLNCEVRLEGYGNKVFVDKSCKCSRGLRICCGSHSCIKIQAGTSFSGEFDILAKDLTGSEGLGPRLEIGKKSSFTGGSCTLYNGEISIGDGCTFGRNLRIAACYGMRIEIGKDCMFSHDIFMLGGDAHAIYDVDTKLCVNAPEHLSDEKKRIRLGEHVWVGLRAVILNGSQVGSGSIIGAMSLVKGRFPNNCMLAGNPAKMIRKNAAWSRCAVPEDGKLAECDPYIQRTSEED